MFHFKTNEIFKIPYSILSKQVRNGFVFLFRFVFLGDLLSCQSLLLFAAFWSWKRHFTGILQHFGVHVAGLVSLGVGLGLVFGFISLLE